ncbi:hypothetical protein NPIL_308341, partial [Nephila pilipes]
VSEDSDSVALKIRLIQVTGVHVANTSPSFITFTLSLILVTLTEITFRERPKGKEATSTPLMLLAVSSYSINP